MTDDDESPASDPNGKLVRTKMRWAEEGRALTGAAADPARQRLPPGQRLVGRLPRLDLGMVPQIDTASWRLSVGGSVETPVTWDWNTFMAQPQVDTVSDIHCVTTWSRYDTAWQGVTARHLLSVVRPTATARAVMLRSHDGYSTNVPLDEFAADGVLLAHRLDGAPLPPDHGGPVRVVVPRLYFWKSAKWLRHIEVMDEDRPGYWEQRGYHMHGDPWTEERYD